VTATQPPEPTKSAAKLIREIAARDPGAHAAALARGYGVGPVDRLPDRPSDEKPEVVHVARCPEHGLHGERSECFVCGGEVEQVPLVPLSALAAVEADLAEARRENERLRASMRDLAEEWLYDGDRDRPINAGYDALLTLTERTER
jgi:hypothetical protein